MPGRSNPGETYMLSLLNRVLLPDHIRSRMPLRLINLISPSRSRLLELPMRGMDAEELARLGTVLVVAPSRRRISRMRRIDCAPHASPAVGPRPLRQRRQRVASEFIFLSAEGAGAAAGARGPRRTARARPGRLGCNLLETARRPTSVPRRRGVPKSGRGRRQFPAPCRFRFDSCSLAEGQYQRSQGDLAYSPNFPVRGNEDVPAIRISDLGLDRRCRRTEPRRSHRVAPRYQSGKTCKKPRNGVSSVSGHGSHQDDPGRRLSRKFLASFDRPWEIFFEPTPRANPLVRRLPMEHEFRRDGGSARGP